jgi:mono/diheme cytochrome c family protein
MATVMRRTTLFLSFPIMASSVGCSLLLSDAQNTSFHHAPASAVATANPLSGQAAAITAGKMSYASHCAACHGVSGEGTGNVPPLAHGALQGVADGAVFWYITRGGMENGMPSWASLPDEERWQLVTFIKSMSAGTASGATASAPATAAPGASEISNAPPPEPPFTDYRFEKPGTIRHITLKDLPPPYASKSAVGGRRRRMGSRSACMRRDLRIHVSFAGRLTAICSWLKRPLGTLKSSAA